MNKAKVVQLFNQYPKLQVFIAAGNISLKAARTILDIDREEMYGIYTQLLGAGAVTAQNSVSWKATQELKDYLEEIKACKSE